MYKLGSTRRFFTRKLMIIVLTTVYAGALISGLFFYLAMDRSLGDTYAQKLSSLSVYKKTILQLSLSIYLPFAVATLVVVVLLLVSYSHKVVGPLYQIRRFAREVSHGSIGDTIRFRKGDAIMSMADTVNAFSGKYGGMYAELDSLADLMQSHAHGMKKAVDEGDPQRFAQELFLLNECKERLDRILSEVKV